jgi:hypothetical protein
MLGLLGAAAFATSWRHADTVAAAPSAEAAIAHALGAQGVACEPADVVWIETPGRSLLAIDAHARALVRASAGGEPTDLYTVEVRLSPEGTFLGIDRVRDITETSGVDESRPILRGNSALYTTAADGLVTGVHVLNLGGRAPDSYPGLTRLQRLQAAVTNLQQTGQTAGFIHSMFALDPVARHAAASWRADGTIEAHADDHVVLIDPVGNRVLAGESFVRVVPDERARPGNFVTWAVDRTRALPWFGDEKMQWVKAVAFTVLDKATAMFSGGTTSEDVRSELGIATSATTLEPAFIDPEIGWPPHPLAPVIAPALPGEGQWIALDKDPFITPTASGSAAAFVTSFVRPNAQRPDVRVYVTLWDPRQIALHMEAGTVEPISATGEHGPGLIPRAPEVMRHVVAAFNGGFQAQHGEYGMVANGIEYLPPKPYAASVVELRDGSDGFGAWPDSGVVPDDVIALRQNLTALVQDGKFNPWGRNWWGGTPPGWPDQVHSTRSAICMTQSGFAGYFYSTSISAEDLARGMLVAGCSFGIHLDMNPGHAGFEFYDVAPEGGLTPLSRRLQPDWEAEGKVTEMPGYVFRSRRMIRAMGHMLFPRYIQREARDFFYLTSRAILPGAPLATDGADPQGDEGTWQTKGLPQQGFPYALATTWVRASADRPELKLRVVRADPRTMAPADRAPQGAPVVLALSAPARGSLTLWWSRGVFSIAANAPNRITAPLAKGGVASADEVPLAEGHLLGDPRAARSRAAVGVQDEDGMLAWVELASEAAPDETTALAMDKQLQRMGCSTRFGLSGDARALLGGTFDAAGHPLANPPLSVARLVRVRAPDAHPVFEDTPIVPIQVWQPLQAKRVRYFFKPPPPAGATAIPSLASGGTARRPAEALARDPGGR